MVQAAGDANADSLNERAKLRASELRRMEHAFNTLRELVVKHDLGEVPMAFLHGIAGQLAHRIRNQHISDESYKRHKMQTVAPSDGY